MSGPCLAVSSNDRLDYFGRTVNIAARIQGLSNGQDVMLSRDYAQEAEIRSLLEAAPWQQYPGTASLKGIAEDYHVVRLTPQ